MAHKPQSTTDRIATLSFADALARETEPCGYDRKKWIYVPDTYEEYRYLLGTVGTKPLVCIGINPSTAHPDHLDNTLKSVERIAHANGYDSFIMVNVYAQRATDQLCGGYDPRGGRVRRTVVHGRYTFQKRRTSASSALSPQGYAARPV